ncbi:hypothetical protein CTI12_AA135510 [Artemisia annua]|uniref:DUF659 domain-containing protein n=1 Tax=Artemisia annua TaxID=35608 RepID=A0A2U1PMT0_ARTAN|nr:hypothetical protein CTI12_AA135510 [Artemisia annua]
MRMWKLAFKKLVPNMFFKLTDNASNNMGAAKLLKMTRLKIFWTSCATHAINLMLEGIGALPILDQAKKLTIFIYSNHKTLAMMRNFTKKRDVVRPGVTRFASAFLTLQSLNEKKEQLRHTFSSTEWEECRLFNTVKGKATYATMLMTPFVKVLRMVDADWKPSMGFVYGELIKAKEDIKWVLGGNKKAYESVIKIIEKKMKAHWEAVGEAMEADENLQPRKSSRTATKTTRELFDEDFESGREERWSQLSFRKIFVSANIWSAVVCDAKENHISDAAMTFSRSGIPSMFTLIFFHRTITS